MKLSKVPENVRNIGKILEENGFECYVVGGAVRDFVFGNLPHDWDLATNATPDQVSSMFTAIPTGIEHGTVTVDGCEITTYRCDGVYSDGRRPDYISFAGTIEEDLSRRDLTINAMAMDLNGRIVDPYDGIGDLRKGIIKCVGNPNERFSEDALRMLRTIRFSSKLDFNIHEETFDAIKNNADRISNISVERIRDEYSKLLLTDNPSKGFRFAHQTGLLAKTIPEFDKCFDCEQNNKYHFENVGEHSLSVLDGIKSKDVNLRWAALLHDVGKPDAKIFKEDGTDSFLSHAEKSVEIVDDVCDRLRFSNRDKLDIRKLVCDHGTSFVRDKKIRHFAGARGKIYVNRLHELQIADAKSHAPEYANDLVSEKDKFHDKCVGFLEDGSAIKESQLKINGNELMELGIQGKNIRDFRDFMYDMVLAQPELNENSMIKKQAARWIEKEEQLHSRFVNTATEQSQEKSETEELMTTCPEDFTISIGQTEEFLEDDYDFWDEER